MNRKKNKKHTEAALQKALVNIWRQSYGSGGDRRIEYQRQDDLFHPYAAPVADNHKENERRIGNRSDAGRTADGIVKRHDEHHKYPGSKTADTLHHAGRKAENSNNNIFSHFNILIFFHHDIDILGYFPPFVNTARS